VFDPDRPTSFNRDDAVVRHEGGHICVWLHYGGAFAGAEFEIAPDGLLAGRSGTLVHRGLDERHPRFLDWITERRLAGELAARRHLGLPDNVLSVGHSDAIVWNHGPPIMNVLGAVPSCLDPNEDLVRALIAARDSGRNDWLAWLRERLAVASSILDRNARAIELLSPLFESRVRRARRSGAAVARIDAYEVFASLRDVVSREPGTAQPVEVRVAGSGESFMRSLKRRLRSLGGRYWPVEIR
jgi:hypothetical protein